jgi:hypothetical protein
MKACTVPAVRQVAFADVQTTIRQRLAVFPVLGYWSELFSYWLTQTDAAFDWLIIKRHCQACRGYSSKINPIT